jgi:hypothetical protein
LFVKNDQGVGHVLEGVSQLGGDGDVAFTCRGQGQGDVAVGLEETVSLLIPAGGALVVEAVCVGGHWVFLI